MSDTPNLASVQSDGFTVTSNTETAEQLQANLNVEPAEKPDLSEAASELGKASAAARKAEKPDGNETSEAEAKPKEGQDESGNETATKSLGKPAADEDADIKNPSIKARMEERARAAKQYKQAWESERQERERLAAEFERFRQSAKPAEAPKPKVDPDAEPNQADFEDYADYTKAVGKHAAAMEFKRLQGEAQKHAQASQFVQAMDARVKTYNERMKTAAEADPTFRQKVAEIEGMLPLPSEFLDDPKQFGPYHVVSDELTRSEKAPALMLYLAEHPEVLQRIASLGSPREVSREMARIEGRLDGATTATRVLPQVSQAKPPVRPVTGAPHTAESVPDDGSSYEDHKRYWDAKEKSARR